ncbi:MAG: hypothetical protein EA001_04545 [Oscillatoriales cyanobacterium]|nr:MAG: hypothetical protein EA001_04545 [Oscillatoriales cyanobacterium]
MRSERIEHLVTTIEAWAMMTVPRLILAIANENAFEFLIWASNNWQSEIGRVMIPQGRVGAEFRVETVTG